MIKCKLEKCDLSFIELIRDIKIAREKAGLGSTSFRRLTKAVANYINNHQEAKEAMINAHLEDDRMKNGFG